MGAIVLGAILSRVKAAFVKKSERHALPHIGETLFAELDSLKFLSYYDSEGRAIVLPVVQATSAGSDRIALVATPFGSELKKIPDGAKASILCLNLKMESVLVKVSIAKACWKWSGSTTPCRLRWNTCTRGVRPSSQFVPSDQMLKRKRESDHRFLFFMRCALFQRVETF
jgi:hypothetical protein